MSSLDPSRIPEPDVPSLPDTLALEEERDYKKKERARNDKTKGVLHNLFLWGMRAAFLCFLAVLLSRVYHLIAPQNGRWLCADDLQMIDKLLFSGTIGAFVGRFYKQHNN